jgi:nitronate monooxygenase
MTDLAALLGIEQPIVLGPFGGLSSVELTALVSERGGLGSYGLYGYTPERIIETAVALRAATQRPFALNLWVPHDDVTEIAATEFDRYARALQPFFDELGLDRPQQPERYLPPFDEQFAAVLEVAPALVSFVFGVPPTEMVEAAHERGIRVVGTATTVDEAIALEQGGVDAVVATGAEAGGHRVSFLHPAEDSLVGTFALVPQVADAVRVPVIAAGGIADRRGVAAAFALGASGVQVGTAFLRTVQSAANDAHRRAITETPAHGTVLTRAMSGRLARGVPNRVVGAIERGGVIAPFPVQNWLTGQFRPEAGRRGVGDLQSLWAGQAAALAREAEASALFEELAAGSPGTARLTE